MVNKFSLFQAFGIEAEYMIVDKKTLNVAPFAHTLLVDSFGEIQNEIEDGDVRRSNELASHVIEIKTNGPVVALESVSDIFHRQIQKLNVSLSEQGLCLMPTAMHPWMNPEKEFQIWTHDHSEIYNSYNRIFNCKGHGWSNLQSVHTNIGFGNEKEFRDLHSAIRILLPLIPALSASSPFVEGKMTGTMDNRIAFYRNNQKSIPEITGLVVPEFIQSESEYRDQILKPMYERIAPLDPQGLLQDEWLNSRGAIARFDRQAIEIRLMDIQESPRADLNLVQGWIHILKKLIANAETTLGETLSTESLSAILDSTGRTGSRTRITNPEYLHCLGIPMRSPTAGECFQYLVDDCPGVETEFTEALVGTGNLAERILRHTGNSPMREDLQNCYRELTYCLEENRFFL